MVGFGKNYPTKPHHGGASCPPPDEECGWDYLHIEKPNPNIILGALVGGPSKNDEYEDNRSNY